MSRKLAASHSPHLPSLFLRRPPHLQSQSQCLRNPPRLTQPRSLHNTPTRSKAPETDKARILEKPTRFNPPSHSSRRPKPRIYPGPQLSDQQLQQQRTKRYPNMMPPEGSFWHAFLTDRKLHAWITLGVLALTATYSLSTSFYRTTAFRDELPTRQDVLRHPVQSLWAFADVYRRHVEHESAKVGEKRRMKVEDAAKRKEFMRAHGVEPGFLTGGWMGKFGTIEDDEHARKMAEGRAKQELEVETLGSGERGEVPLEEVAPERERKKRKVWLGIW